MVTRHRATTLTTRSPEAEAVATHRAMAFAQAADAPVHVVHLSCAAALRHVAEAKAAGVRAHAETCPHYLTLTDDRYHERRPVELRRMRHLAAAPPRPRPRRDVGRPRRRRRSTSSRPTTSPDRSRVEKGEAANGVSFDKISNGAPGIETLLAMVYAGRGQGTDHRRADGRRPVDDAGPPVRARSGRARSRPARTPTSSSSTLPRAARSGRPTSTTRATTRRTRASTSRERSGRCSCAAGRRSATARSSASAGSGRFVERGAAGT